MGAGPDHGRLRLPPAQEGVLTTSSLARQSRETRLATYHRQSRSVEFTAQVLPRGSRRPQANSTALHFEAGAVGPASRARAAFASVAYSPPWPPAASSFNRSRAA